MRALPLLKPWAQTATMFAAVAVLSISANAQTTTSTLISDIFADGVGGNTGSVAEVAEANFFTTSSSAGIDNNLPVAGGGFRFISGSSGRAIHTLITPTTLATAGDRIDVSFDFTTPDTVRAMGGNEEFRFGLFDTSNAAGVNIFTGRNITATPVALGTDTGTPVDFNANIPSGSTNNQPGLELAGFTSEIDIENNTSEDISFRVSDVTGVSDTFTTGISGNGPSSGRLTTTTQGFDGLGSGPDFGAPTVSPNTSYTATLSIELLASGDFEVTSSLDGGGLTAAGTLATDTILATGAGIEAGLDTNVFDLLTFSVSSDAFGTINSADSDGDGILDADNGITFNSLLVTSTITEAIPEPSSLVLLGLLGSAGLVRRRR